MKILLLSDLNSIHTKKWVASLAKRNCEICVFGLSKPQDDFYESFDNVIIYHSNIKNQYAVSGAKKVRYLKVVKKLKQIYSNFLPDIVHAHYATSYGLLGTFLKHNPYLISVWGEDVFSFPKESKIKKILLKRNLKKADYLFSTSKIMAKETAQYTTKKVNVVPFGVDIDRFKNFNLPKEPNKLTVGIVKTLEDKYGIKYLIEAFSQILATKKYQNLELLIVGKGSKEKELKKQVSELKLNDSIIFTGAIPHNEVPAYFNKMDIVVIPSVLDGESFGVAAVEASACEIPVVVCNVGGLPEVVIDGETGLICPPRDSKCLADKMMSLLNDKQLRMEFGAKGRLNAVKNYNWEKNVDLMIAHYKSIMEKK